MRGPLHRPCVLLAACTAAALLGARTTAQATSFEDTPPGPFEQQRTAAGTWLAEPGHARIDPGHARTGSRCLHLLGGEAPRRCELVPPDDARPLRTLSFWAERWTRAAPFDFVVEQRVDGSWSPLYRSGTDTPDVVIGGFRTRLELAVDPAADRFRFTCTSPSGVLVDDVRLGLAAPMRIVRVGFRPATLPVLAGRADNPVGELVVVTEGGEEPVRLARLRLEGAAGFARLRVVAEGGTELEAVARDGGAVAFRGSDEPLREGRNAFVVLAEPSADALGALAGTPFRLGGGHVAPAGADPVPFAGPAGPLPCRPAVALRDAGDDGAAVYRIPGLVQTDAGTLLAAYDVRWKGWGDLPGDIDVGISRSTDGGRTWEPMRIVLDMGKDPAFRFDGVGDPSILVDRETDTVWIAAVWSHGDRGWHGSGPGLTPEETGQLVLTRSEDDGRTWSEPVNITAQVKDPAWTFLLQGPGRGIQMRDGTLVFPAQFRDSTARDRIPCSTVLTSRNHGATWQIGAPARRDTTEAQVVELEDGVLMLNMRDNRGGSRAVATTWDLGRTWAEHPTSRGALVEPVCNAALLRASDDVLLFVNPAVPSPPRRNMTLRASPDLGQTWPDDLRLLLDEGRSAGYPSIARIDDATVGVLYESSRAHLVFQRIEWRRALGLR